MSPTTVHTPATAASGAGPARLKAAADSLLILLHRLGRHRALAIAGLFTVCLSSRVVLLHRIPPPQPAIHDEFAYLLGADTFASGHLANPPHPLHDFFETMHVLSRPRYAMKYQPAQSLFLAFGQKTVGNPYFGVVLSVALMTAAFCWMLQAWVPPGWALLGGLFALRTFHVNHYWMQSYWGGAVTALGAALVIGAYGRVTRGHWRAAWAGGAGMALLLLSRPYEGSGLLLVIGAALLRHLWKLAPGERRYGIRALALPLMGWMLGWAAFQGVYNRSVTGNWLTLPYMADMQQNQIAPFTWILKPFPPKSYDYPEIAALHTVEEMRSYRNIRSRGVVDRVEYLLYRAVGRLPSTFQGVWIAWLLALWLPDRRLREAALLCAGMLCFLLIETWLFPHYEAPMVPLALLLITRVGWRMWHVRYRTWAVGPALVALFLLIYAAPAGFGRAEGASAAPVARVDTASLSKDRPGVIDRLRAAGGRHVVIVRYAPTHNVHQEWVYNAAAIDASAIVWARDRGPDNRRLFDYYRGRTFWLVEPDEVPYRLTRYAAP